MRRILLCSKVFSIFPRFSPTIFYRDAISVLLQILAHLCTAVLIGSMPVVPVAEVPRNPLTRWDVSSIPANGIFLTKKLKN